MADDDFAPGATPFVILVLFGIVVFLYFNQPPPVVVLAPTGATLSVHAYTPNWTVFYCEVADRMTPCDLKPGDVIEAWGTVSSNALKENNAPVQITPKGIAVRDLVDKSTPYVNNLPRFALIGRMRGSQPFLIGNSYTVQNSGQLELLVNGDYRDKWGRTHDEWFGTENRGDFTVRLKR